jgi:hypothetical protein
MPMTFTSNLLKCLPRSSIPTPELSINEVCLATTITWTRVSAILESGGPLYHGPRADPSLPSAYLDLTSHRTTNPTPFAELVNTPENRSASSSAPPSQPTSESPQSQHASDAAQASSNASESSDDDRSEHDLKQYPSSSGSLQHREEKDDREMHIPEVDYDQADSDEGDELEETSHDKGKRDGLVEFRKSRQGHADYTMSAEENSEGEEGYQLNESWHDGLERRDETPDDLQMFHGYRSPSPAAKPVEAKANSLRDDSEHSLSSPEGNHARFLSRPDREKYDCHTRDTKTKDGDGESTQGHHKSKSVVGSETDDDDDKHPQRVQGGVCHGLRSTPASFDFTSELERAQYRLAKSDSALMQEALRLSVTTEGYVSMVDEDEPVMDVLSPQDTQHEHVRRTCPDSLRSGRSLEDESRRYGLKTFDPNAWLERANEYNQTGGVGGVSLDFGTDSYFRGPYHQGNISDNRWRSEAECIRFLDATQGRCNLELPRMSGHQTKESIGWSGLDPAHANLVPDGIDPELMDPPLQQISCVNRLPDEDVRMLYSSVHHMSPLNKTKNDFGIWTPQDPNFKDDDTLMMEILMDIRTQRELYHKALPSICSTDGSDDFLIRIIRERVAGPVDIAEPMDVQAEHAPPTQV